MEYKLTCENCGCVWVASKSVYYRRLKEERIFCRKCHTNLIGMKSEACKLGREKIKKTCIEKYGVDNPAKASEVKEKTRQTCLKKYGTRFAAQNKKVREKIKQTTFEHFGVTCSLLSKEYLKKKEKIFLNKFGVDNPAKAPEIKEKMVKTRFERYGTFMPTCKYRYDGLVFDSSWEVAFYIYFTDKGKKVEKCKEYFEYEDHKYYPDFKMDNEYYEIKGEQFFKENKFIDPYKGNNKKAKNKWDCMIKNNVKILRYKECKTFLNYVNKKYGKGFIQTLKC